MKFKCQMCGKERPCIIEIAGEGVPPKFCPYGNDQEQPAEWVVDIITNRDVINAMSDEELADSFFAFGMKRTGKDGFCRVHWQNPLPCRPWLKCNMCLREWLKAPAGKHQKIQENSANN